MPKSKKLTPEQVAEIAGKYAPDIIKGMIKNSPREIVKKLKSKSKKLQDIVFEEGFIVNSVVSESIGTSVLPMSEMSFGGYNQRYKTGYKSKITLEVRSLTHDVPVKTLEFYGQSIVKSGDHIIVKIPRYKEKHVEDPSLPINLSRRTFYLDRKYKKNESAIEIQIMPSNKSDKNPDRIDRAVNYSKYLGK
jgi:hypothetical protein